MPAKTTEPAAADEPKKHRVPGKLRKRVAESHRRLKAMYLACRRDNTVVQLVPKSVANGLIHAAMGDQPDLHIDRITRSAREATREAVQAVMRRLLGGVHLTKQLSGHKRTTAAHVAVAGRLLGMQGTESMISRKSIATAMGELDEMVKPASD